ncbi:MAG: DUF4157 domain-containing protein [Elusimicrobia bacterium]|nr:DUF4157 domain-containing protein [Elusimicrobiota bacterium]
MEKKCGCPADQTLTAEGKCACPSKDQVPTIAEKCEPKDSKKGRSLTFEEMEMAKKIFGDKIDYRKIKIVTGKDIGWWGKMWLAINPGADACRSDHTIYFPNYNPDEPWDRAVFMHEMTHVYQADTWNGVFNTVAFWVKTWTERNGEYVLIEGKPFNDYNFEQQAMIVWDYYYGHHFTNGKPLTADEKRIIKDTLDKVLK